MQEKIWIDENTSGKTHLQGFDLVFLILKLFQVIEEIDEKMKIIFIKREIKKYLPLSNEPLFMEEETELAVDEGTLSLSLLSGFAAELSFASFFSFFCCFLSSLISFTWTVVSDASLVAGGVEITLSLFLLSSFFSITFSLKVISFMESFCSLDDCSLCFLILIGLSLSLGFTVTSTASVKADTTGVSLAAFGINSLVWAYKEKFKALVLSFKTNKSVIPVTCCSELNVRFYFAS